MESEKNLNHSAVGNETLPIQEHNTVASGSSIAPTSESEKVGGLELLDPALLDPNRNQTFTLSGPMNDPMVQVQDNGPRNGPMPEYNWEGGNGEWPATTPSNEQRAYLETSEGREEMRSLTYHMNFLALVMSDEFQAMANAADGDADDDSDNDASSTWSWDDDFSDRDN